MGISDMCNDTITDEMYEAARRHWIHRRTPMDNKQQVKDQEKSGDNENAGGDDVDDEKLQESPDSVPLSSESGYIGETEDNKWWERVPHIDCIPNQINNPQRQTKNNRIYDDLLSGMCSFEYQNP